MYEDEVAYRPRPGEDVTTAMKLKKLEELEREREQEEEAKKLKAKMALAKAKEDEEKRRREEEDKELTKQAIEKYKKKEREEEEKRKKEKEEEQEKFKKLLMNGSGMTSAEAEDYMRRAERKAGKRRGSRDRNDRLEAVPGNALGLQRPTYIQVHRKHISPETLDVYQLPWEWDSVSCTDRRFTSDIY